MKNITRTIHLTQVEASFIDPSTMLVHDKVQDMIGKYDTEELNTYINKNKEQWLAEEDQEWILVKTKILAERDYRYTMSLSDFMRYGKKLED